MSSNQNEWTSISIVQWIYWLGATLVAAVTIVVFLYSTFQTKSDAAENKFDLERRLERIEGKIDTILMRTK